MLMIRWSMTRPPMDGSVEPHVFAQFERIAYSGNFNFHVDSAPRLYFDDKLNVRAEDADKFLAYLTTAKSTTRWVEDPLPDGRYDKGLRETLADVADITISSITVTQPSTTDVIQNFVELLSTSPCIRDLEINLMIDAKCSKSFDDMDSESDSSSSSEDLLDHDREYAANTRATELFLESGVLCPLSELSNVRTFSLKTATCGRGDFTDRLQQKHSDIIKDLKQMIERNWEVKHGPD